MSGRDNDDPFGEERTHDEGEREEGWDWDDEGNAWDDEGSTRDGTGRARNEAGGSGQAERGDPRYRDRSRRPDAGTPGSGGARQRERRGPEGSSRLVAALVGGVATFFLGLIPILGTMAGGAVAGYLRGNDTKEGVVTGGMAGLVASIPAILIGFLLIVLGGIGALAQGDGTAALGIVFWIVIFALAVGFNMALCAAGGAIGAGITDRRIPR